MVKIVVVRDKTWRVGRNQTPLTTVNDFKKMLIPKDLEVIISDMV